MVVLSNFRVWKRVIMQYFFVINCAQEELPEGSWYCWHCICQSCGNAIGGKTDISTSCDLKCLQCGDSCMFLVYHFNFVFIVFMFNLFGWGQMLILLPTLLYDFAFTSFSADHDTCIGGITCDGEMGPNAWFCGMICQEVKDFISIVYLN